MRSRERPSRSVLLVYRDILTLFAELSPDMQQLILNMVVETLKLQPGAPVPDLVANGRKKGRETNSSRLLAAFEKDPDVGWDRLALATYGQDTPATRKRTRSLFWSLKSKGRIPIPNPFIKEGE